MKFAIRMLILLPLLIFFSSSSPASAATTHVWMQNGWTSTHQFASGDSAEASYFFNRSGSYGTGSDTSANPISNGYATTPCLVFTADTGTGSLETAISNGTIPSTTWPSGSCVLYDNEAWTQTPAAEQQNPEFYMAQFNDDAYDAGFVPWDSPALDLGNTDTTCPKSTHGGTNVLWYQNCDIAKAATAITEDNGCNTNCPAAIGGVVVQNQTQENTSGSGSTYNTLYTDAVSDVGLGATNVLTEISQAQDTSGTAGTNSINAVESLGTGISGVFLVDTNADAASSEGWEDNVMEALHTAGW